jgi:hypothetical protein
MDIEKEMKKLKEQGPAGVSLSKMAKLLATMLDKGAVGWVGKIFWDKKFQKLAKFDKLEQAENDRIFNELIVAPLVLLMITLEAPDLRQPKDFREYSLTVRDEIPKAHLEYLKSLEIKRKYLDDWEKLIKMRYDEYNRDKLEARQAMMEFESKEKDLTTSGLEGINLFLPVFTVAVGCHHHLCRGKTKGKDELFKYLIKQLSRFYVEFRAIAEGAEITPWKRFKVKLRHFWNDLKGK